MQVWIVEKLFSLSTRHESTYSVRCYVSKVSVRRLGRALSDRSGQGSQYWTDTRILSYQFPGGGLKLATNVFKSVCVSVRVRSKDKRQWGVNTADECCVCGSPSQVPRPGHCGFLNDPRRFNWKVFLSTSQVKLFLHFGRRQIREEGKWRGSRSSQGAGSDSQPRCSRYGKGTNNYHSLQPDRKELWWVTRVHNKRCLPRIDTNLSGAAKM